MDSVVANETGRALPRGAAGSAPPLADVGCCRDIPDFHEPFEPSTEPQLHPGQVLDGRFIIREVVTRSGMATIYRAEDMAHGRRAAAIKVPLRKVECDSAGFARFLHEEEIGL